METIQDFKDYFWYTGSVKGEHTTTVTTKIRKEFMLTNPRNVVVLNNGRVELIIWKNLGGGVWEAKVKSKGV